MSKSMLYLLSLLALARCHPPDVLMEETEAEEAEQATNDANTIPKVILNEVYQFSDKKFVEIMSEESGVSLQGYYIIIMDFSKTGVFPPSLKMRAAIKLSDLTMTDHYGYIGKILDLLLISFLKT